jgi:hypothetical protein
MDKVTQQAAANAEESAAASEELSAQAEQMQGYVGELATLVGGRGSNGHHRRELTEGEAPAQITHQDGNQPGGQGREAEEDRA